MIAQIFAIVQLLLRLFGLWEQFLAWSDKKRIADADEKYQELVKELERLKNATDEAEFDRAQSGVVDNLP